MWNATPSQSGRAVEARNMPYNATLAPGATIALGFQASYRASNASPTAFTFDGTACTVV